MRLALFQPDIPQNFGAALRLTACMGVALDVIHPCGFVLSDKNLRRAAMDYATLATVVQHADWAAFLRFCRAEKSRIVLMTTQASVPLQQFSFHTDDIVLMGRESAGVPPEVHTTVHSRIHIPMGAGARSLNVVNAASMALWEGLRQTGGLPATGAV